MPRPRVPPRVAFALAAIFAAALALRLAGAGWLLPQIAEPDGIVLCTQVELFESGAPEPERELNYGFYPHLVARLAALVHDPALPADPSAPLAEHLARAARLHEAVRRTVSWLSLLVVPATWFFARRFLGPGGALAAALLAATSTLLLWFSVQARPHAAAAAFALIATVALVALRREGRVRDHVAAGVALGLAIGALQNGLALLPAYGAALLLRSGRARRTSLAWSVVTLALLAGSVLAFYPFLFAPSTGQDAAQLGLEDGQLKLSGHLVYLGIFDGGGAPTVVRTLLAYEPWIALLSLAGLLLGIQALWARRASVDRDRLADLAVVLAYVLPYTVAIALYARTYQRFVIPLVPFLVCLAAYAVVRATAPLARRGFARGAALVLLLLAPQVVLAGRVAWLRSRPDTAELAAEWVRENTRPGERVFVLPTFELPLFASRAALEANRRANDNLARPWSRYQLRLGPGARADPVLELYSIPLATPGLREAFEDDPESYLRGLNADWLVVEVYSEGRRPLVLNQVPPALPALAERVARFAPLLDQRDDLPLTYQDDEYPRTAPWMLRALRAEALGPVIEIWRVHK